MSSSGAHLFVFDFILLAISSIRKRAVTVSGKSVLELATVAIVTGRSVKDGAAVAHGLLLGFLIQQSFLGLASLPEGLILVAFAEVGRAELVPALLEHAGATHLRAPGLVRVGGEDIGKSRLFTRVLGRASKGGRAVQLRGELVNYMSGGERGWGAVLSLQFVVGGRRSCL
ncbi:hypothetical protein PG989_015200 [Apiospora arundinis]